MIARSSHTISRTAAEIATALGTGAVGTAVVVGALDYGTGWSEAGPEPGTFPFYVGLIVVTASLGNLVQAIRHRGEGGTFLTAEQARSIAAFFAPMAVFVAAAVLLGLYVATALYLCAAMRLQGGYRLITAIVVGVGTAVFFYLVLEVWFKVALLKGPLEAALGLS